MIRVLLVDDSPVALAVLKQMISSDPTIEVVGTAPNGIKALELIPALKPHVVCTDLHMPHMDGLELTRRIMSETPLPILVISIAVKKKPRGNDNSFKLLDAGAIELFPKPKGGLDSKNHHLVDELVQAIKVLAKVIPIRRRTITSPVANPIIRPESSGATITPTRLIAIGASTGGPIALQSIFSNLPRDFPIPIVCVQHINPGFLKEMISWMQKTTTLKIQKISKGTIPLPGNIYFAPTSSHMVMGKKGSFKNFKPETTANYCPCVDFVFSSLARYYGQSLLGLLLTGMGRDGASGLLEIAQAGGETIAQDEASSVVFGMPSEAIKIGGAKQILSLESISGFLKSLS
jgi:two-component system, chemotaxis family, protein-glutamate methylesterase/glutaminase